MSGSCWNEHVNFATRDPKRPVVLPGLTVERIWSLAERGHRISCFFDEIDKFSASEFKLNALFHLLEALEGAGAQVVAISNKSLDQLAEKFGDDKAVGMFRRICSKANGAVIQFDEEG